MDLPPCEDPSKDKQCAYGKPDLWASNIYAWQLFQECSNQVIVAGMGDVLGISFSAIDFIFNLYKIEDEWDRQCLFEKIMTVDRVRILAQRKKTERELETARRKARKH